MVINYEERGLKTQGSKTFRVPERQGTFFRALLFKWMETFFALPIPYIHSLSMAKAYILLQRETTRVGSSRWLRPPVRRFRVGNTNMLVSEKPCRPNAIPNLPNATPSVPNVNQCNTLCVGYARVKFALFVSFFFVLGMRTLPNANMVISGIWA